MVVEAGPEETAGGGTLGGGTLGVAPVFATSLACRHGGISDSAAGLIGTGSGAVLNLAMGAGTAGALLASGTGLAVAGIAFLAGTGGFGVAGTAFLGSTGGAVALAGTAGAAFVAVTAGAAGFAAALPFPFPLPFFRSFRSLSAAFRASFHRLQATCSGSLGSGFQRCC